MKDVFKKLITDFHQHRLHPTIPRDMHIPFHSGKIISLVGVRRSGKTSIQSTNHHPAALEMASNHLKQGRLDRKTGKALGCTTGASIPAFLSASQYSFLPTYSLLLTPYFLSAS